MRKSSKKLIAVFVAAALLFPSFTTLEASAQTARGIPTGTITNFGGSGQAGAASLLNSGQAPSLTGPASLGLTGVLPDVNALSPGVSRTLPAAGSIVTQVQSLVPAAAVPAESLRQAVPTAAETAAVLEAKPVLAAQAVATRIAQNPAVAAIQDRRAGAEERRSSALNDLFDKNAWRSAETPDVAGHESSLPRQLRGRDGGSYEDSGRGWSGGNRRGIDGPAGPRDEAPAQTLLSKVYGWMTAGLGLTALASYAMTATGAAAAVMASPALMIGLVVAELALVLGLTFGLRKLSPGAAAAGFGLYSVLNGITLSPILLLYTASSVAAAFAVTAGMFGGMALWGHATKRDLSGVGSFAIMALLGVILASVVNIFLGSAGLALALTYASVLIFVGLTAYDAQKIRQMAEEEPFMDQATASKLAIIGALTLYLDFVNLFINILKLLGKRKD